MNAINRKALLEKIEALPAERLEELESFVDLIRQSEAERATIRRSAALSAPSFARVWDNPEDDVYNEL